MNVIYFIDETMFKDLTPVNLNVEQHLINMSIQDAQLLHLQMTLGTKLYKKLESLISSKDISLPANAVYKTLLDDYVVKAVAYWALAECAVYVRYKIMNKGVQSQNSENSTPIELEELKYIQERMRNSAEFYSQRIADYLCANSTLYPEYTSATDLDEIDPSSVSYFSGMQLDDYDDCDKKLGLNSHTKDIL